METIGFIGLGLIGGSIAKGIRLEQPENKLIACGASEKTLNLALQEGVVDEIYPQLDERMSQCDMIFLCAPVEYNISYLSQLKTIMKEDCLLTDVGSTKTEIHRAVAALDMEDCFIGGHPMAGSEKSGFEHSSDHLVENAWYVLTPTAKTTEKQLDRMKQMTKILHSLCIVLDHEEHDRIVAAVSHVPHLIAAALVNLVKDNDNASCNMKQIAAGGFKDITRIASSSPIMWEQICTSNSGPIADMLDRYIDSLQTIREQISSQNGSAINQLFETSRTYRDSIPNSDHGPLTKEYSFYCDIVDRAGAIATIATTISAHQINMKNIGIIHNRMFDDGVLKIEFYDEPSMIAAQELLQKWNYNVIRRDSR